MCPGAIFCLSLASVTRIINAKAERHKFTSLFYVLMFFWPFFCRFESFLTQKEGKHHFQENNLTDKKVHEESQQGGLRQPKVRISSDRS